MLNYPKVTINLAQLEHNANYIAEKCHDNGIKFSAVIKVTWGDVEVAKLLDTTDVDQIASSRVSQLEKIKAAGVTKPLMLIRIPMKSEAADTVRVADYSLHSDIDVLRAFNAAADDAGVKHKVIIMKEMGDLREGIWDHDEFMNIVEEVEHKLTNLVLVGIGTNLGCYGSILSTPEKMQELVDLAHEVEAKIGRKLEVVSGGGTRAYARLLTHDMPEGITHLRIGCNMLIAQELKAIWNYDIGDMYSNIFCLHAEVLEVREKPTHPIGEIGVDAFRNKPTYEDRGIRKKALLGVGKADYGQDLSSLTPVDKGIELVGASGDHTIIDVTDCKRDIKAGDIITFHMDYGAVLPVMASPDVRREYVRDATSDY